jgi:DNA-binding ferritin-like protein
MKTKNSHWHISRPHFRDYHLLLDEHADAIFTTIDALAERVRKDRRNDAGVHRPHRATAGRQGQ